MSTNFIEEFFIAIGFDTKRVKKEAKEIDKILDGLTDKKRKGVTQEAKEKKKLYKLQRQSEADNFKHFLKQEKEKQDAVQKTNALRRKQAVASLTSASGAGSAKSSASVFQEKFRLEDEVKRAEKIKDERQRKRYIKRKKHRAMLASKRLKEEQKANDLAQKALKERLRIYKKAKREATRQESKTREKDFSERLQLQARAIQRSPAYQSLKARGKLGDFDQRMLDATRMGGRSGVEGLKDLKAEIGRTNAAMTKLMRTQVGLHTVQGGLTDSTRNMIRSYASLYALFEGTTAIKRVGQDFESLRASMLVVSEDKEDAAKKMGFVREQAYALGVDLKTAAKAYLALSASSADALGEEGVKGLFTSVMKISRAFGMSVDDTKGTFKAFTQIEGLPL